MKTLFAGLLIAVSSAAVATALPHSEDWCADSVDFSMRTAQRRDEGTPKHKLATEIHTHFLVFQQQYPSLAEGDMQHLVDTVYQHGWSRFKAAIGATKVCGPTQSTADSAGAAASAGEALQ